MGKYRSSTGFEQPALVTFFVERPVREKLAEVVRKQGMSVSYFLREMVEAKVREAEVEEVTVEERE